MASTSLAVQNFFRRSGFQQLAGPLLILLILSMMVLPLPPFLLDLLFTFNIAISIIVMLVAINV
ncbi:MAG: flagellar biosynthesis protein FlhA, partial [Propionivibrio sp.]